jgi:predicted MFS family arabinose efflux permease
VAKSGSTGARRAGPIFGYFAPLALLVYLTRPNGYGADVALTFIVKDYLHATAEQVANFRLVIGIPIYLAFCFGLARDLWNPFRLRDRGFLLVFGTSAAAVFLWLAWTPLTYAALVTGILLVMVSFAFVLAAFQGLIALVGQEQLMSGRLSAVWNIFFATPDAIAAFGAGYIAEHLSPHRTFLLAAALCFLIALYGLWKPRAVFTRAYDQPLARGTTFVGDIRRLLRHRAIYPAVLIIFMFQFSPGGSTPLQFQLTDVLHASDAVYADFQGLFLLGFVPAYVLYGYLCQRMPLRRLLWLGILISVPQMLPLAFIGSASEALWLAPVMGLLGGLAFCAIIDLAMRSCPPGLQGTLMMLTAGAYELAWRGGDLLGARIYASSPVHGFLYCALATTAVYALILPVLLLVPKELTATADGERNPIIEAEVLAEIREAAT